MQSNKLRPQSPLNRTVDGMSPSIARKKAPESEWGAWSDVRR